MSDVAPSLPDYSQVIQNSLPPDREITSDELQHAKETGIYFDASTEFYNGRTYINVRDPVVHRTIFLLPYEPFDSKVIYYNNNFFQSAFPPYKFSQTDYDYINSLVQNSETIARARSYYAENTDSFPWQKYNTFRIEGYLNHKRTSLSTFMPLASSKFSAFYSPAIDVTVQRYKRESSKGRPLIERIKHIANTIQFNFEITDSSRIYSLPDFFYMDMPPVMKTLTASAVHLNQSLVPSVKKAASNLAIRAGVAALSTYAGFGPTLSWALDTVIDYGFNYLYNRYHLDPFQTQVYYFLNAFNNEVLRKIPRFEKDFCNTLAKGYIYITTYNSAVTKGYNFYLYKGIKSLSSLSQTHQNNLLYIINHTLKSLKLSTVPNINQLNKYYQNKSQYSKYGSLVKQLLYVQFHIYDNYVKPSSTHNIFAGKKSLIDTTAKTIFQACHKTQGFGLRALVNSTQKYIKNTINFWTSPKGNHYYNNYMKARNIRNSSFQRSLFYSSIPRSISSRAQRLRNAINRKSKRYKYNK